MVISSLADFLSEKRADYLLYLSFFFRIGEAVQLDDYDHKGDCENILGSISFPCYLMCLYFLLSN